MNMMQRAMVPNSIHILPAQSGEWCSDLRYCLIPVFEGGSVCLISGLNDWCCMVYLTAQTTVEHFTVVPHPKDFFPKSDASLTVLGHCASYDTTVGQAGEQSTPANNMACSHGAITKSYQSLPKFTKPHSEVDASPNDAIMKHITKGGSFEQIH